MNLSENTYSNHETSTLLYLTAREKQVNAQNSKLRQSKHDTFEK